MLSEKISVTVGTDREEYTFTCIALLSHEGSSRHIDRAFYENAHKQDILKGGPHYELELLDSIDISSMSAEVHVHPVSDKQFVCWTGRLPTFPNAVDLFKIWCVGMAYAIDHDADFAPIYSKHTTNFLEHMERIYSTRIIKTIIY